MKVIDLSHTIKTKMPVFPGDEHPVFRPAAVLEKDGFMETEITLSTHTGTHLDVPAHIQANGLSLDELDAGYFIGKAAVLDVAGIEADSITKEDLLKYRHIFEEVAFALIMTGWSKYWGDESYYKRSPSLSPEAAWWLAGFNLKGIGIDTASVDEIASATYPVHKVFLEKNMVIIENLTNLDLIRQKYFIFSCLPLRLKGADGSPVRAVAIEDY